MLLSLSICRSFLDFNWWLDSSLLSTGLVLLPFLCDKFVLRNRVLSSKRFFMSFGFHFLSVVVVGIVSFFLPFGHTPSFQVNSSQHVSSWWRCSVFLISRVACSSFLNFDFLHGRPSRNETLRSASSLFPGTKTFRFVFHLAVLRDLLSPLLLSQCQHSCSIPVAFSSVAFFLFLIWSELLSVVVTTCCFRVRLCGISTFGETHRFWFFLLVTVSDQSCRYLLSSVCGFPRRDSLDVSSLLPVLQSFLGGQTRLLRPPTVSLFLL